MKKQVLTIFSFILLVSFALAISGLGKADQNSSPYGPADDISDSVKEIAKRVQGNSSSVESMVMATNEMRLNNEGKLESIREHLREQEQLRLEKLDLNLTRKDGELLINQSKHQIRTRLNISIEGNGTMLKAKLSNGRNAEIKIMPSTASERALERLRLKVCTEERNCTIVLKEVGNKSGENQSQIVYEVNASKEFKLFGFMKRNREVTAQIDAETGEIVDAHKPWWAFLATESDEE